MNTYLRQAFQVSVCLLMGLAACQPADKQDARSTDPGPASSDPQAVRIADEIMEAMGGRQAWDSARYFQWTHLGGSRNFVWDKQTGRVRIDVNGRDLTILLNQKTGEGRVRIDGRELTPADSLDKYLQIGQQAWSNDSYWLFMPFRLKEDGARLRHAASDRLMGKEADVLELTFRESHPKAGKRYLLWIDRKERLLKQWAYFPKDDRLARPSFTVPWSDYERYGDLLLSSGKGSFGSLTDIAVHQDLPDSVFGSFADPGLFQE